MREKGKIQMSTELIPENFIAQTLEMCVGQPCILCENSAEGAALFTPFDSCSWGSAWGKQRYIIYPLCKACLNSSNAETVEAVLYQHTMGKTIH